MDSFQTLRNQIAKVAVSGMSGQALTFLSLPIISRLYTPEAFGGWAMFLSFGLVFASVATLRYELAIVLPRHHRAAAAVLAAGLVASVAFALVAIPLLPLLRDLLLLGDSHESEAAARLLWTLPMTILAMAAFQLGLAWCTRRAAFTVYSLGQFLMPALTAAGQICAALVAPPSATGLIAGTVIGYGGAAIVMWGLTLRSDHRLIATGLRIRRASRLAVRYRNYPLYMTPYTLLSTVRDRAVYFLLGTFGSDAATGNYAIAQRFTNIPNSLVSGALRPVFFQFSSRRDPATLGPMVATIIAGLMILAIPNLIVFLFHAEFIVTLLFGDRWEEAAPFAMLLALPALPMLLGNWFDRILDVLQRQRLAFVLEVLFSLSVVAALAIGLLIGDDVMIAVGAQVSVMFAYFTIWIWMVFRAANFGQNLLLKLVGLAAGLAFGSLAVMAGVRWLLPEIAAVATFYVVYLAILGMIYAFYGAAWAKLITQTAKSP